MHSDELDLMFSQHFIAALPPQPLIPPNTPAITTGQGGFIYIILGGSFFTGTVNGRALGGFASGMPLAAFQQLVILHEFLHWTGIAGPDNRDQKITFPNGQTARGSA